MKTKPFVSRVLALGALAYAAAVFPANAQYGGYSSVREIDWAEKELFLVLEGHFLAWDFRYGGGGTMGLEYVNSFAHFGLGARSGFGGYLGTSDDDWDVRDMTWDSDVYIPVRLTDSLTIYGGVGITYHDCSYKGIVQSESYSRNGRTKRYTYTKKTVTYTHGSCADTTSWFGGVRLRVADNFFVFGEYRKTEGTLDLSTSDLDDYSKYKRIVADFDADCITVGLGWLF